MKDIQMEQSKETRLKRLIMKGWRERWTDADWGCHVKTVVPRGVSGDAYNLAEVLLNQALGGGLANSLIMSFLRLSLSCHQVSHSAVLKHMSTTKNLNFFMAIEGLLEFIEPFMNSISARYKPEEALLPSAVLTFAYWLLQVFAKIVGAIQNTKKLTTIESSVLEKLDVVVEKFVKNEFLMGILCIAMQEDGDYGGRMRGQFTSITSTLAKSGWLPPQAALCKNLQQMAFLEACHLEMLRLNPTKTEAITYCLQPLLVVEVLLNPCRETQCYVNELQMIQRLKKFSNARLYYEIVRAGFITLIDADDNHRAMWAAFNFFKMSRIIKKLHSAAQAADTAISGLKAEPASNDYVPEVIEALEMLLMDTLLLDCMDTKFKCNIIENLLRDWAKQNLVNDLHVQHFATKRESDSHYLQHLEKDRQQGCPINQIIRAESTLDGILKTLDGDYNKMPEQLLNVLCELKLGTISNSPFDLLLALFAVDGRLKRFAAGLVQCNENSKQLPGEVGKPFVVRCALFDVSFLMLTFIVQSYGSDIVLAENADSFFGKWVRECMVEYDKPKSPQSMLKLCDEQIVNDLLLLLRKPDAQLKTSNITWQDICLNLPGVINHVLSAWERETLSSADVKIILENIKFRLYSFSVCATSFLAAYMHAVKSSNHLKPLNMIQQFLVPSAAEQVSTQEKGNERLGLCLKILRKMQQDVIPSGSLNIRGLVSNETLIGEFKNVWSTVAENCWLPVKTAQKLQIILQAGGAEWLACQMVEEALNCMYTNDIERIMEIVFGTLHLHMEDTTVALLERVIPRIVEARAGKDVNEPQTLILARLLVYCIISNLENSQQYAAGNATQLKRSRSQEMDETLMEQQARKIQKTSTDTEDYKLPIEFKPNILGASGSKALHTNAIIISDRLQNALKRFFEICENYACTDELTGMITFVFQFLTLLVECGNERVSPVQHLIPPSMTQNLLKIMQTQKIKPGLICQLYDLRTNVGRQAAVADLCLQKNLFIKYGGYGI